MSERIHLRVDGEAVPARRGESVALALVRSGRWVFGRSVKYHRPRGPVCFRGRCEGCLMRVNGVANEMTCQVPVKEGMRVETQNVLGSASVDLLSLTDWVFPAGMDHHHMFTRFKPTNKIMQKIARRVAGIGTLPDRVVPLADVDEHTVDVLVIGAGRSGMAAANAAAKAGAEVWVVGESMVLAEGVRPSPPVKVFRRAVGVAIHYDHRSGRREILVQSKDRLVRFNARALVVATGAARGALAFEGNDLPGVISVHAARVLRREGIDLGDVVVLGEISEPIEGARVVTTVPLHEAESLLATGKSKVTQVRIGKKRLSCDVVVAAGPLSARYELAGQAGAVVRWQDDGFVVETDDHGKAGPSLFAVGSCAGMDGDASLEHAQRAGVQAGARRGGG